MALIVAVKKGDISSWRGTTELIDDVRRTIAENATPLVYGDKVELLSVLQEEVSTEIQFEETIARRVEELLGETDAADSVERLKSLTRRGYQLVAEHFERRSSVVAVHEMSTRLFDRVFRKVIGLAALTPELEACGREVLACCWMAAEEAGRGEMTLMNGHRLFLVYDDSLSHAADRFREIGARVGAALAELGVIPEAGSGHAGAIWCGSTGEWQAWLKTALLRPGQQAVLPVLPALAVPFRLANQEDADFLDVFAAVADLRLLAGDEGTGAKVLSQAREALGQLPVSTAFAQAARQIAAMPVAINLFGWFRVERSGKHRGEFDIEIHALKPLVMNVRLLAVTRHVAATGTIDRVRALLAGGHLSVDTAEKIVRAYHEIARQRVRMEVSAQRPVDGLFLNPEDLNDVEEQKFKGALEAVVGLERLVHSQLMESM
jgi:CBS domain-containing protein